MPKHKQDVGELWITFLSQFVFHFFKSADAGIFLLIFVLFTFQFKCKGCNFNCINWKIHRWWAWDSNLGWQDGRRRRIHWPPCVSLFLKWAIPCFFFFIFVFSRQLTVYVQFNFLPMTGFELWTSGIGRNRSTHWDTTTVFHFLPSTFLVLGAEPTDS